MQAHPRLAVRKYERRHIPVVPMCMLHLQLAHYVAQIGRRNRRTGRKGLGCEVDEADVGGLDEGTPEGSTEEDGELLGRDVSSIQ